MEIDTYIEPPGVDEDGDGEDLPSSRLGVHFIGTDDVHYDAGVQLFGDDANGVDKFAEGLLNVALAVASLRGSDYAWAVMQRFAAYDGGPR